MSRPVETVVDRAWLERQGNPNVTDVLVVALVSEGRRRCRSGGLSDEASARLDARLKAIDAARREALRRSMSYVVGAGRVEGTPQ